MEWKINWVWPGLTVWHLIQIIFQPILKNNVIVGMKMKYNSGYAIGIFTEHYDNVIMSAMASQITSLTIVYAAVCLFRHRSKKTPKLRVTCEFPAQMASDVENVSIWWRYHGHPPWGWFSKLVLAGKTLLFETMMTKLCFTWYKPRQVVDQESRW